MTVRKHVRDCTAARSGLWEIAHRPALAQVSRISAGDPAPSMASMPLQASGRRLTLPTLQAEGPCLCRQSGPPFTLAADWVRSILLI
jgi:hypothetical protein